MDYESGIILRNMLKRQIAEYIDNLLPVKYHIYESCTFTVPYDTDARIIAVGKGGEAKGIYNSGYSDYAGGGGGGTAVKLAKLKKGEKITIKFEADKTSAIYEGWTISGYNGGDTSRSTLGAGGAAEGGGQKSTSVDSVIVGDDIQLIAGGNGGGANAIAGPGKTRPSWVTDKYNPYIEWGNWDSQAYGGGASYFGGNGGWWQDEYIYAGGDGGSGLYGGGDGAGTMPINSSYYGTDFKLYAGKGGDSEYGCGGNGGNLPDKITAANCEAYSGPGGNGHLLGGKAGKADVINELSYIDTGHFYGKVCSGTPGKGEFLSAPSNQGKMTFGVLDMDDILTDIAVSPASHSVYKNYPAQIPMIRPIGSGGSLWNYSYNEQSVSLPGVGAVIIEFGVTEFLKTY